MALSNYNRKYELIVGVEDILTPPESLNNTSKPLDNNNTKLSNDTLDFRSINFANAVVIKDLQIQAKVVGNAKSKGSNLNQSEIKIFNLSESTREKITAVNKPVILKAGYELKSTEDALPIIFVGQISKITTEKQGQDIITTLFCTDGKLPANSIRISKCYNNITYGDLIRNLVTIWNENGIKSQTTTIVTNIISTPLTKSPDDIKVENGWCYFGLLKDAMDDICKEVNYKWSIVNGIIYINPITYNDLVNVVEYDLNKIKSIKTSQEGVRGSSTKPSPKGVKLITLLNGELDLSKKIRIDYGDRKEVYNITSIMHSLDFRGNAWDTEIECEVIENA